MRIGSLLAFVCLVASGAEAIATDYYLSLGGNDASPGLSAASPWKTFAHGVAKLRPGDRLIVADGTYAERLEMSEKHGNAAAPIVIRAQKEGGALLKGPGSVVTKYYPSQVYLVRCSYVRVEGLRVEDSAGDGVSLRGCHHVTLRRLTVMRPSNTGNNHGIGLYAGRCWRHHGS